MGDSKLEAYLLLTLPTATLGTRLLTTSPLTGPLSLSSVTPPASPNAPDVLLLLRIASTELVLDPNQPVTPTGPHSYALRAANDRNEYTLEFPPPSEKDSAEDVELLHAILSSYGPGANTTTQVIPASGPSGGASLDVKDVDNDTKVYADEPVRDPTLRGRFVLVDNGTHSVVGALDANVRVREDPVIHEKGHEHDPVVVELPEGVDELDELSETEVMVRSIPKEDRGWMLSGAVFAR